MNPTAPGRRIPAVLILATLLCSGCSTLIKQSYEGDPSASNMKLSAYSGSTAIYGSTDPEGDGRQLVKEEYARIGVSKFMKDGRVRYEELQSEANDVGADIVLFSVKWAGSREYLPPIALNGDGAPYTLAPFVYPNSAPVAGGAYAGATSGAAAISGQQYEYTLSFWRKSPHS
jgi:hypothetical protein